LKRKLLWLKSGFAFGGTLKFMKRTNHLSFLFRNKVFGALWCSRLVSDLGDRLELIAVPWLIYQMTGSASSVAVWYISISLPSIFFGSFIGVLLDRFDRRRVMIVADLIRGALICLLPFAQTTWQIYTIAFTISFFYAVFGPAMEALLPDLLKDENDLLVANSLTSAANSATVIIGPVIGGFVIAQMGLHAAFFLDAFTFLISAVIIWGIKIPQTQNRKKNSSRLRQDWLDGFKFIRQHPTILWLILITALPMLVIGVHGSLLVVYAREFLRVGSEGLGYLTGAIGIGTLAGSLGLGIFGAGKRKDTLIQIGLVVCGLLLVLFGFTTVLWLAVLIRCVYGVSHTLYKTSADTMLQEEVPTQLRGRILSIRATLRDSALLLSAGLAGLFADSLGAERIFMAVGGLLLVVGIVGGAMVKRSNSRQTLIKKEEWPVDKDSLEGLWKLTNSVVLVTTASGEKRNVMTACGLAPIGTNPPTLAINIATHRYTYDLIQQSGEFAINILSVNQIREARLCGSTSGRETDKFELAGLRTKPAKKINVPLIEGCVANLECRLVGAYSTPHSIVVGQVVAAQSDNSQPPLVMFANQLQPLSTPRQLPPSGKLPIARFYVYRHPYPLPELNEEQSVAWLSQVWARHQFSLYVHIPFCTSRCHFCQFDVVLYQPEIVQQYLKALARELQIYSDQPYFQQSQIRSVYMGGGTPTTLSPDQLSNLVSGIRQHFTPDTDISVESTPNSLTKDKLAVLHDLGISRLTIGVQSFDQHLLRVLGRRHSQQQVVDVFELAHRAGFNNVGMDLLYGLPAQTLDSWQDTLTKTANLRPEHISIYPLGIFPSSDLNQSMERGIVPPRPEDGVEFQMHEMASDILAGAGYIQYTGHDFALPGKESKYIVS
jgi:flavin reductase (DIM6/NTAB) family NADH-FMN oxidoreductase RutF/predicted MFS family arabinose efflux permease